MAVTSIAAANTEQQWSEAFFREWQRADQFADYTSKSTNAIIQVTEELTGMPGNQITQSLVTKLSNSPTTGDNTLAGSEEAIGNYGYKHTVAQFRHAVTIGHAEQKKSHIDMLKAATPLLKEWRAAYHRDEVIASMRVVNVDGSTRYASTAEADKDTFIAANTDRVLFGTAKGNYSGDHDVDLAKVDSTNDVLDRGVIGIAKRMAKLASPKIRPVQVDGYGEFFVLFAPSYCFRDCKADLDSTNASAEVRGSKNPIYNDGNLMYDGVLIVEVPEIPVISGVGYSSINVGPCFLCGAQAIGYAVGERSHSISDEWDYKNRKGVGIGEISVVNKLIYNNKQHGMVLIYCAAVADA